MRASLTSLGPAHLAACGGRTAPLRPTRAGPSPDAAGADAATVAPLRCTPRRPTSAPDPRWQLAQGALCRFDGDGDAPGAIVLAAIDGDASLASTLEASRGWSIASPRLPFAAEPGRAVLTARGEHRRAMTWIGDTRAGGARGLRAVLARRDGVVLHRALEVLRTSRRGNELRVQATSAGCSRGGGGVGPPVSGWTSRRPTARSSKPQEAYLRAQTRTATAFSR
nr:hypothetical protein [Deltaproteobacteria bacterium]